LSVIAIAYEEALEIYRTLAKTNPDAYLSEMAMTLNSLGIVYRVNNAHTKAQSAYEEALEIYRTLAVLRISKASS
jgi:tetratricopeptide (TPR) repeat protein